MKKFIAVVHKDEDSSYGLHFPDVEGCFAASHNMQTLIVDAIAALSLHFEDKESPTPRTLSEISSDKEVQENLKNDAFLIVVPHGQ